MNLVRITTTSPVEPIHPAVRLQFEHNGISHIKIIGIRPEREYTPEDIERNFHKDVLDSIEEVSMACIGEDVDQSIKKCWFDDALSALRKSSFNTILGFPKKEEKPKEEVRPHQHIYPRDCPWCKSQTFLTLHEETSFVYTVKCINVNCPVRPETKQKFTNPITAIEVWNMKELPEQIDITGVHT